MKKRNPVARALRRLGRRVVADKTKYTRKTKHRGRPNDHTHS